MTNPQPDELTPVDPRLIQELFDQDPLKLTDQDLDTIVAAFRQDRQNYLQSADESKGGKGKGKPKKEAIVPLGQIDLAELGL